MHATMKVLNDLLAQLGSRLGLEGLQIDSTGACSLSFDDRITISVHCDEESECVVFSAEVGTLRDDCELELSRVMLQANYAWQETGGVGTLSIGPDVAEAGRTVFLMHQAQLSGFDWTRFQQTFDRFLETAEAWTDFILTFDVVEEDESADLAVAPSTLMRV